ncbi:MAG: DUF3343 domain-containing protein [Treponema sp.]|jgi:hypothetical protein|nr:DUF3343 domain-containing protein [Treponema sp.]
MDPCEAGPEEFVFSFHGTAQAILGERRLLDAGLPVMVMPSPPQIGPGCGICLRVRGGDLERARMLLGAEYRGLFRRTGPGSAFTPWNP